MKRVSAGLGGAFGIIGLYSIMLYLDRAIRRLQGISGLISVLADLAVPLYDWAGWPLSRSVR